jgi:hypothetical protein
MIFLISIHISLLIVISQIYRSYVFLANFLQFLISLYLNQIGSYEAQNVNINWVDYIFITTISNFPGTCIPLSLCHPGPHLVLKP